MTHVIGAKGLLKSRWTIQCVTEKQKKKRRCMLWRKTYGSPTKPQKTQQNTARLTMLGGFQRVKKEREKQIEISRRNESQSFWKLVGQHISSSSSSSVSSSLVCGTEVSSWVSACTSSSSDWITGVSAPQALVLLDPDDVEEIRDVEPRKTSAWRCRGARSL